METVILKNGAEEAKPLVVMTMISLEKIMKERHLALYDLVMRCRDRTYQFFSDNEEYLKSLNLVDRDGSIHGSIRNIVLSAAEGDGLDMVIRSPIAE
jgi:hypothetical protein